MPYCGGNFYSVPANHCIISIVKGIIVLSYDISELKQAEEDVLNSERRFADTINFWPDAAFVINTEGKVMAWNRAIELLTGVKAQEIVGKGNYEYAIPFYGSRRPILIDLALDWNDEIAKTYQYVKKEDDTLVSETRNPADETDDRIHF